MISLTEQLKKMFAKQTIRCENIQFWFNSKPFQKKGKDKTDQAKSLREGFQSSREQIEQSIEAYIINSKELQKERKWVLDTVAKLQCKHLLINVYLIFMIKQMDQLKSRELEVNIDRI